MNLKQKLIKALAGATSQNPISTEVLARGHSMRSVKAALMEMYQERKVCCCECFKDGARTVSWWLPGNVMNANYNQTTKANKRAAARARLLEVDDE